MVKISLAVVISWRLLIWMDFHKLFHVDKTKSELETQMHISECEVNTCGELSCCTLRLFFFFLDWDNGTVVLIPSSLPSWSQVSCGKTISPSDAQLTAIQNQLSGFNNKPVSKRTDRAERNVTPLSPSLTPLFLSTQAVVREHAGGDIPLVAHYSLLGQWEGASLKGVGCPVFCSTRGKKSGVCRIADVVDAVETRGRILLHGGKSVSSRGGGGSCGANRCSKYLFAGKLQIDPVADCALEPPALIPSKFKVWTGSASSNLEQMLQPDRGLACNPGPAFTSACWRLRVGRGDGKLQALCVSLSKRFLYGLFLSHSLSEPPPHSHSTHTHTHTLHPTTHPLFVFMQFGLWKSWRQRIPGCRLWWT